MVEVQCTDIYQVIRLSIKAKTIFLTDYKYACNAVTLAILT